MIERKCKEHVTSDGWHFHECGRPAKYVFVRDYLDHHVVQYLCGMHSRTERKYFPELVKTVEEYEKCQQN